MAECKRPEKISRLTQKCDAELSIEARRILRWETHCSSDCVKLVWTPTQQFLERLAAQKPQFLLCCRSKPFYPNQNDEECVDVDIISPDWKTAYLGMVVNMKQAISAWKKFALNCFDKAMLCADALPEPNQRKLFNGYAESLQKLLASGPLTIIRENVGCLIPVETDCLSQRTTQKGIKKIISVLMPVLADLPVRWAPAEEQKAFERFVKSEAQKRAKPQTKKERLEIFRQDIE